MPKDIAAWAIAEVREGVFAQERPTASQKAGMCWQLALQEAQWVRVPIFGGLLAEEFGHACNSCLVYSWRDVFCLCMALANASTWTFPQSLKHMQHRKRNENVIPKAPTVFYRFNSFQIELSPSCYKDHVAVYDGSDTHAPLLGKFCGSELPPNIKSSSNHLFLVFSTDFYGTDRGWKATFRETLGKCIVRLTICW